MRINVLDNKDDKESEEIKEVVKEGQITDADILFDPIQSIVLEYIGKEEGKEQTNRYVYKPQSTFFRNLTNMYTQQIAHNLLWHIDVDKTLELAKHYPLSLLEVVEIKDPHGQRIKGTPLQIVAAAGDRNPSRMKTNKQDYGLVERLRPCFQEFPHHYDSQLEAWFSNDADKQQTKKTMAPYLNAIKTLCQEIILSKDISDRTQFKKLRMRFYEKFKSALSPDPNHVVTSGFLFDLQIFLDFIEIWQKNIIALGNWGSLKSNLFAAIVYPALQARAQRIDLEVLKTGIAHVVDKGFLPNPINFAKGIPKIVMELGRSFFYGLAGQEWDVGVVDSDGKIMPRVYRRFSELISSKKIGDSSHEPTEESHLEKLFTH